MYDIPDSQWEDFLTFANDNGIPVSKAWTKNRRVSNKVGAKFQKLREIANNMQVGECEQTGQGVAAKEQNEQEIRQAKVVAKQAQMVFDYPDPTRLEPAAKVPVSDPPKIKSEKNAQKDLPVMTWETRQDDHDRNNAVLATYMGNSRFVGNGQGINKEGDQLGDDGIPSVDDGKHDDEKPQGPEGPNNAPPMRIQNNSQVDRELMGRVLDHSTPSLRPQYGIAGGESVVPPTIEQIRSDIEFDLFNLVQPGYGEGADNKLFLYQEAWKKFIQFAKPFYSPNNWLGPLNYQHPLPWQWQNVKDSADIARYMKKAAKRMESSARLIANAGEGSLGAFGKDVPEVAHSVSSSGLPRDPRSPFEPVIHNKDPWQPVIDPAGKDLERQRGWKRNFAAWRDPDVPDSQPYNGGPHLRKRRALEVILR